RAASIAAPEVRRKHRTDLTEYTEMGVMSALGQKQTFTLHQPMSALPLKADICGAIAHVRFGSKADSCSAHAHVCFTPESRHVRCTSQCLLWAISGHLTTIRSVRPRARLTCSGR